MTGSSCISSSSCKVMLKDSKVSHLYKIGSKHCFPLKTMKNPHRDGINIHAEASQLWDALEYRKNCFFVPTLGKPVLDLLAPVAGERVLDLGSGEGLLTKEIVQAGCKVTAVDSSQAMIDLAQRDGLNALVMDGQDLKFDSEFDAVFSNAAIHWMSRDPQAVVTGVKRALVPGGRFVAEFGGFGNVAAITTAAMAVLRLRNISGSTRIPWFFPTANEYRELLEGSGFHVETIELIPRPTHLPAGMSNWYYSFGDNFFQGMSESERAAAIDEAVEFLRPALCDRRGLWTADYVRLRVKAVLPE